MKPVEGNFRIKYHGKSVISLDKYITEAVRKYGLNHVFEIFKSQAEVFADDFVLDSVEEIDG